MRPSNLVAPLAAMLLGAGGVAHGAEVLKTENATMNVGGRVQLLGFAQNVQDTARDNHRLYLFLKQGRLMMSGNVDAWRYGMMIAFGGEDEIKAPTPGVSLALLDAFVDIPLTFVNSNTYVRVGQFRVPYSRERLTESGTLLFADRSVQNLAFRMGRDVGATVFTKAGPMVAGLGLFTAGGRDVPERYLPQTLGTPMVTLRAGIDTGLEEDVFVTRMSQAPPEKPAFGFFVNALYTTDSLVGHSSVFITRPAEKSLLLNANWNPYLARAPFQLGKLWQVGADVAMRAPMGPGVVSAELEANFGVYQNKYGDIRVPGGRAQVAYELNPVHIALRYSLIQPDSNFAASNVAITGTKAIQQLTPALTYNFKGFPAKIIFDLPIQINTPVIFEEGVGSYLLVQQPDQTSMLKNNAPITRQDVVEARMLVQAVF